MIMVLNKVIVKNKWVNIWKYMKYMNILNICEYAKFMKWVNIWNIWLIWKDPDAGKDWGQEEKGTTEEEMVV